MKLDQLKAANINWIDENINSLLKLLHGSINVIDFIATMLDEYLKTLDLIKLNNKQRDDILYIIYDRRRIEIDRYGNLFDDRYVFTIVDILQNIFQLYLTITDIKDNIDIDYNVIECITEVEVNIKLLRQKMIMAVKDIIARNNNSEGGKKPFRIRPAILKLIVMLKNDVNYGSDFKKISAKIRSATKDKPIKVDDYNIYRVGSKIYEEYHGEARSINIDSLRRYIEDYSERSVISSLS